MSTVATTKLKMDENEDIASLRSQKINAPKGKAE
jgi:hypothetical protein